MTSAMKNAKKNICNPEYKKAQPSKHYKSCKKLYWYSRYGRIEVLEQRFIQFGEGGGSQIMRPFQSTAQVHCRGYSKPLQRVITDFGADVPFGQIPELPIGSG